MQPLPLTPDHKIPLPLPIPEDSYRLQTSALAGSEYYQFDEVTPFLTLGSELQLIPEPANPHDKYAVRVHSKEHHLGYLPRTSNHIVSRLLCQGAPLTAQVAWISPDSSLPLSLHIFLKKA